jgi:hypothetical protein
VKVAPKKSFQRGTSLWWPLSVCEAVLNRIFGDGPFYVEIVDGAGHSYSGSFHRHSWKLFSFS